MTKIDRDSYGSSRAGTSRAGTSRAGTSRDGTSRNNPRGRARSGRPDARRTPPPAKAHPRPAASEETRTAPEGWLEGRNPIQEALRAERTIHKMWVLRPADQRPDPVLRRLVAQARATGAAILEVDRVTLDRMTYTKAHQGVIAQVAAHAYADWQQVIADVRARGEQPLLLLLDELKDPYNLGSILRIADAAGVHCVVVPTRNSVGLDALTAKASAGAIEHVPVARVVNLAATLRRLKKDGFWIAGTDATGSIAYDQADYSGAMAIVVGSEGSGLGRLVREHCDFLVRIPMQGHINSLNVAVATGIVVFEAQRRRKPQE